MISQEYFNLTAKALQTYAKATEVNYKSQSASEMSYYDDFKRLLESIFPPSKGYLVQSAPRMENSRDKPDFCISLKGIILFSIEAKPPRSPIENLISIHSNDRLHDQITRYTQNGTQLLITDFMKVYAIQPKNPDQNVPDHRITDSCVLVEFRNNHLAAMQDSIPQFQRLLARTCESRLQTISNVKKLISPLADIAKAVREMALNILNSTKNASIASVSTSASTSISASSPTIAKRYLESIRDDFRKSLFKEEVKDDNDLFADLFAQTLIYGAFSAWIKYCQQGNPSDAFTIAIIGDFLPYGSFLRDLFLEIRNRVPKEFKSLLDEMESRFQKTEYVALMDNVESLITTFYSDFLILYDPITAKDRGVVYTPHEIVDYMIRGIDFLLSKWLNVTEGILEQEKPIQQSKNKNHTTIQQKLSTHTESEKKPLIKHIDRLRILDPAAGTMAFACGLLHVAKEKLIEKYAGNEQLANLEFEQWVINEFFKNMYAFEILMAPYVLGHIRTFLTLEELGVRLNAETHKLNSYLMNTLMTPPSNQKSMDDWMFNNQDIGREIKEALAIRDKRDIFIIMGNPPYNLSSQNNCSWINEKLQEYKEGLEEKNQKILADDYVKFLRFGQWKIEQVGTGILAFITNSRYLDGQMFSVMRKSLRKTFDKIYVVNLHGDMRKNESGNPFDIRVGVAIAFMVRIDNSFDKNATVYYMDVPQTTREEKFRQLANGFHDELFRILPDTRQNFFIPIDTEFLTRYEAFTPINLLFKSEPTSGIMVGRDRLLMDVDASNVAQNMQYFFTHQDDQLEALDISVSPTKSWTKEKARAGTSLDKALTSIRKLQYRGFDYRYLVYDRSLVEGHRMGYIDQISPDNPAITVTKSSRKKIFDTAWISPNLIEKCYMSVTDTAYAFPLKLNGKSNINLPPANFPINDEDIFYYCYGILHSPTYRTRYDEHLRKDYPRIPIVNDQILFTQMRDLGFKLAQAHLMRLPIDKRFELSDTSAEDWIVNDYYYEEKTHKLYFAKPNPKNSEKNEKIPWVGNISPEIWNFTIGSNPQLEQFLISRRFSPSRKWNTLQRGLNSEELLDLLRICTAIKESLQLRSKLEEIYCQIDQLL
jgi:hypothetical protein